MSDLHICFENILEIDPNDIIHTKITDTKVPSSDVKPSDQSMKGKLFTK